MAIHVHKTRSEGREMNLVELMNLLSKDTRQIMMHQYKFKDSKRFQNDNIEQYHLQ